MKKVARAADQRANDAVHAALKHAIVTSVLRPGERLNVGELAEQLGVSLTPVRNAVQLLAAEGLIDVRPRSGTFVAQLSAQDVRETFEIRCALESLAAEKAARTMTPGQVKELTGLLEQLGEPVEGDEARARHQRINTEFHRVILQAAGNQRLFDAYQSLNAHIQIARVHAAETDWRPRLAQEHREHTAIVEAIAAGNSAAAAAAMREHIERACDSLTEAIAPKAG